ncbi:hypothetical protein Mchl_5471 (plasmid) [Methylorubrum extorquens CM4]|jgi:hypothetical protein|uniref:Uncharacterized protein n=1 Tax=Methylorubrum extorquens (strain CM4 / NCIMB 13688) TaxID=440085 RepID=B7L311_METC4|nr:hypothetical protein Mchl_5471 [Methylorubrum extorquens CM4]
MTRPAARDHEALGLVFFRRQEPTGAVGPPRPPKPAHYGVRPPAAQRKPPGLSRAELRRIVIDILG